MHNKTVEKDWLSFLDGVRGFAALWVLAGHCAQQCGWHFPYVDNPAMAVDIFIIMSGFLMAYHYRLREDSYAWDAPRTWYTFYIRRFFRIAPLYYCLVIPAFLLYPVYHDWQQAYNNSLSNMFAALAATTSGDPTIRDGSLTNILLHITFLFGLFPQYASSTLLPDWSIGLEMQFYAVFPFLMLFFRKFSYFNTTVILLAVYLIAWKLFGVYVTDKPGPLGLFPQPSFLPLKITLFTTGILLAEGIYHRKQGSPIYPYLMILAVFISAIKQPALILPISIMLSALIFYDRSKDPLNIGAGLSSIENFLSSKFANFLGDTSYSVYLLHKLLLIPVLAALASRNEYIALPGFLRFAILFTPVALLTYSIAILLYRYIEKPGIAAGKAVLKSWL
jgi:peptidoglycan/LPS O-acetylase OafA/YrhL